MPNTTDASDRLSPILVKELRQGMRGRLFLNCFLLIQVAMIFCASGALLSAASGSGDPFEFFSGLFWFIIAVPLLMILPWIGQGSLRNEMKANGLELVYLTRMTPWRIVAGKWAALFAQSLLFVFSVLPYLVLRYFLGGVDLLSELTSLAFLMLACGVLVSVAVGFSAHNPWMVRGGLFLLFFWGFGSAFTFMMSPLSFGGGGVSRAIDTNPYVLSAVFLPVAILLMFEIGTSKIAPAAEARSLHMRALGLLLLAAVALLNLIGEGSGLPLVLATPVLLLIALTGLCESPRWIPSIYTPYVRRGAIGRLAGRFLFYPGWPSAVFYTTILTLILAALALRSSVFGEEIMLTFLVIFSALVFPVALTRFIRPLTPHGMSWFLGTHLGMLLLAVMVVILQQADLIEAAALVGFLPTCLALLIMWDVLPTNDYSIYITTTSVMIALSLGVLLFRGFPLVSLFRKMEERTVPPASPHPTETAATS